MTTGKTIALTRQTLVGKVMSLLFNMLSRLVKAFLPTSNCNGKPMEGLIWDIIYLILKLHCSIVNPWNKKNLVGKNNFPKRTTMILKVTDKRGVDESQQKRRK